MKPLRILVVEDDPVIGMLLGEMLLAMGHEVCSIERDEGGAVAAAARHHPDLVIADATLGAGSGLRAIDTMQIGRMLRHQFIAGDALRVARLRPDAVILQKPFNEAALTLGMRQAFA